MKTDNVSANKYRNGEKKVLSLTIKTVDGRIVTVDYDTDEAKGLAVWILFKLKELDEIPIEELEQLPDGTSFRIIGRLSPPPRPRDIGATAEFKILQQRFELLSADRL